MKQSLADKKKALQEGFREGDRVLVAYSGGVDSTLLMFLLSRIPRIKVRAVTIKTPYIPEWEVSEAKELASQLGVDHDVIELSIPESVLNNPPDRCYRCKKILFSYIKKYASDNGYNIIVDGTNADDRGDYRPGMKALEELGIRSPLLEAGFAKSEIRELLKMEGLKIWDKPAYACLLTRIPHDTEVDIATLTLIEKGEKWLHEIGLNGLRLRLHGDIARLECDPKYFNEIIEQREEIISYLHETGIKYITLDLEGYRTGSMNLDKGKKE